MIMTYASSRSLAVGFLALYALVGMWAHVTRDGAEDVYPFFSWSLFAQVPPRVQDDFEVLVSEVGGKPIGTTEARNVTDLVDGSVNYQMYVHRVREFGRALRDGSPDLDAKRRAFEAMLSTDASYEVTAIRYDPVERLLAGGTISQRALGAFRATKAP